MTGLALVATKRGIVANCEACGAETSRSKRFCGDACRKRASWKTRLLGGLLSTTHTHPVQEILQAR